MVREDSLTLFGFSTTDERELFDQLTGVTGVGPKVALSFLSALRPDAIRRAVVALLMGKPLSACTARPLYSTVL